MVILEHKSGYKLGMEESLVARALDEFSLPYKIAVLSQVERGRVDTRDASLVVGSIPFIHAALRQRKISVPKEQTYPPLLSHLMHRSHQRTTLKAALKLYETRGRPIFIKPAVKAKRFTGLVLDTNTDWLLGGVSRSEPVWVVDVVTWMSEWRLYVDKGTIVHKACYIGDLQVNVDLSVVQEAITLLSHDSALTRTYAIDFGVLSTGETALIELNDAYGIGAYEMERQAYLRFLQSGWDQLLRL